MAGTFFHICKFENVGNVEVQMGKLTHLRSMLEHTYLFLHYLICTITFPTFPTLSHYICCQAKIYEPHPGNLSHFRRITLTGAYF